MDATITHHPDRSRFEAEVEGQVAFLQYAAVGERELDYHYTFVPPPLRRKGVGILLVQHALDYAATEGFEVIPSCWFVKMVIDART